MKYIITLFTLISSFTQAQPSHPISVPYMEQTPVIDGKLDGHLNDIPKYAFRFFTQFDNPETDSIGVTYSFAYNYEYLYLYIETEADTIHYHKRGYLWGDGFKLLIATPNNGEASPEYYELSYSPTQNPEDEWDRQRIAAFNRNQRNPALSEQSKSQELAYNGKSGFEVLISWSDIEPYHPAFMDEMGYGLYFAKGKWLDSVGYFSNGYSVVYDPGIFGEEITERLYELLIFEEPKTISTLPSAIQISKRLIKQGENLNVEIKPSDEIENSTLSIQFKDKNDKLIQSKAIELIASNSNTNLSIEIPISNLSPGEYSVSLIYDGITEIENIGVIADFEPISMRDNILKNASGLSEGTQHTLLFKLEQITNGIDQLYWYETGTDLVKLFSSFMPEYDQFIDGNDPYQKKRDPYRRAFLSYQDSTYQPYSINLPDNYDPSKKYPLLVFLHGSGQDEQGLLNAPRSNGEFIEIAPYGRDIYFTYASETSQIDIREAIEDATKHFSINTDQVIIGGFSMGGYGALRTYYENPDLYSGIAIFAGHPNLANLWLDGDYPDFTQDTYTTSFKDKPVFVYHGEKDPALDVGEAKRLIQTLSKQGAIVTSSIVPDRGHVYQDEKTNTLYHEWLNQFQQ